MIEAINVLLLFIIFASKIHINMNITTIIQSFTMLKNNISHTSPHIKLASQIS